MRWMTVVAAVVFASACSDDATGPDPISVQGTYTLETVNTFTLPIKIGDIPQAAFTIWQVGGSVRLNGDRTYREVYALEYRFNDSQGLPVAEADTVTFTGIWESEDSVVTVKVLKRISNGVEENFNDDMFGFVSANRLTLSFEESDGSLFTFVYRRD